MGRAALRTGSRSSPRRGRLDESQLGEGHLCETACPERKTSVPKAPARPGAHMCDTREEPVHPAGLSQAPERLQGPRAFQGPEDSAVPGPGGWGPAVSRHSSPAGHPGLRLEDAPGTHRPSSLLCLPDQPSQHSTENEKTVKIRSLRSDHPFPSPPPFLPLLDSCSQPGSQRFPWTAVSKSVLQGQASLFPLPSPPPASTSLLDL